MIEKKSRDQIREILEKSINGEYNIFVACMEIYESRSKFVDVPNELMDIFTAVSSEVDDLPIYEDRKYWDTEILKEKDIEIENYQKKIESIVLDSMRKMLAIISN